ncbi:hypothetical protein Elgi_47620 [Paenibacillus elgii]|uniref:hypothetical protein n=1 Tax=Paenibacillus elgii TaxID=189691 RepID=UPI002D7C1AD8|nr:hypothetical protein Elgi_47620 [Paenibacillus elgii]
MKKTLNEKIWYGVFVHHSYPVIAQEINSPDNYFRRWAAVYSVEHFLKRMDIIDLIKEGIGHRYLFLIIDIPIKYIDIFHHSWDSDLYERNIKMIYAHAFDTESSLYEVCEKLNVDLERFEASWKVEYIFD